MVGRHYTIEPLGLLHHLGLAKTEGWEPEIFLAEGTDFSQLAKEIQRFKPDLVGFSIWTGYHKQAFEACDEVRSLDIPVVIGGPHATYFSEECVGHANYVIKGSAFRNFHKLLRGELPSGINFDHERMAEGFPVPAREIVYDRYTDYAVCPIKSLICSDGCPFKCTYCYAPAFNKMYGGFELNLRPVDQVIDEVLAILKRWPLKLIYMQDDIFGFNLTWLREFVEKWKGKVGVPWHCQIRLELTEGVNGDKRLDLFREAGCTGITLAIESGNDFLRRHVLFRGMPDELIVQGIQKINDRGFTLRTEQILAVPFSDFATDLETADLNVRLGPQMAWTSILVPYLGTSMGSMAKQLGFYTGNNDDLKDTFFERSVLSHVKGGPAAIEEIVRGVTSKSSQDLPLLRMHVKRAGLSGDVCLTDGKESRVVGKLEYLNETESDRYRDQTVMIQRLFDWATKLPEGHELLAQFGELEKSEWTWKKLGEMTKEHLDRKGYREKAEGWEHEFANTMDCASLGALPESIKENPFYFAFLPSGPKLARKLLADGTFDMPDEETFRRIGRDTRHHLYDHWLYRVADDIAPPIAKV